MKSNSQIRLFAAISAILLFSLSVAATEKTSLNVFEGSFESALQLSRETNKPIFVKTFTEWCGWCKRMDANTLSDDQVIAYLNENFITVKIDAEKGEGPAFAQKYDATRYPTILFFNPEGEVYHSFKGYKNPEKFLEEATLAIEKLN